MSKDDCYKDIDFTGQAAGVVTAGELGTHGVNVTIAGLAGLGVQHGVDYFGHQVCDAIYDQPALTLLDVDYDNSSHLVTYAFGSDASSNVTFEYADLSCQPLDEGVCVPDSTPNSGDHGSMDSGD